MGHETASRGEGCAGIYIGTADAGRLPAWEEGCLDGDPLAELSLLEDPEANLLVIMKGGVIYKDRTR